MACTRESTSDVERQTCVPISSTLFKIAMVLLVWNLVIVALLVTALVKISNLKEESTAPYKPNATRIFRNDTGGRIKANKTRPVIHLTGYSSNSGKLNDEILDVWMTGRLGQASPEMTSPGATLNVVTITETGNYFVYAQLYFQVPFNSASPKLDEFDESYSVFFVCRVSKAKKTILMRSVASNGFQGKKSGFYTSYMGSVHRLKKGDVLFVSILKKQRVIINTNESSSFFGAFKL